jgi:MSHA biogenesis protein MshK
MAKNMKRILRAWRNGWVLLSLGAIPAISFALTDPTKPPAELSAPSGAITPEGNDLQSVIISPTRRAAIIGGQTIELGGKAGDVRLIEVGENGVVLQGEKGRQVLTLFPNVKIDRKAILPPMEDDFKSTVQTKKRATKSARQAGNKEEK